jgi:hypothetical protein
MSEFPASIVRRLQREFQRATGFSVLAVAPDGKARVGSRSTTPNRMAARGVNETTVGNKRRAGGIPRHLQSLGLSLATQRLEDGVALLFRHQLGARS